MLAKPADELPSDDGWLFEPKWDGFRAIVFRDGDEVYTQSRDLKPLDRYFPELADPLRAALPERCILDGEVVISKDGELDFEALLLRIHPAASRVKMLAEESPASFVAWDLLALGDDDLRDTPQGERRALLETALGSAPAARPPDARDDRPGARPGLVPPLRGRRPRRRDREAPGRHVPAGQAGDAQDQAPANGRLRRCRLPLAQERARARTSGRCSSGCSTTRARSTTSGSRRRSRGTSAPPSSRSSSRSARTPSRAIPGASGRSGRKPGAADASGQRLPGATSPLEPRQGPVVGAAPRRARRRGRLRPPPGRSLPPRDDVQALAPRQAAGRLPLRPARGNARLRDREDLRRLRPGGSHVHPGAFQGR